MNQTNPIPVLSAYATYSELSETRKTPYDIIHLLLLHAVVENGKFRYNQNELVKLIASEYGLSLPLDVLIKSLKKFGNSVKSTNSGEEREYVFDESEMKKSIASLEERQQFNFKQSEKRTEILFEGFYRFTHSRYPKYTQEETYEALNSYVLDEHDRQSELSILASEFVYIVSSEDNNLLDQIRKGSILYNAISNVDNLQLQSLKYKIRIYFSQEILFDLYGLNGTVYQQMANDFLKLVRKANKKENMVYLFVLQKTIDDINLYFEAIKQQIENKTINQNIKSAARILSERCTQGPDIYIEKQRFLHCLQTNGIMIDEENYQAKQYSKSTLNIKEIMGLNVVDSIDENRKYSLAMQLDAVNKVRSKIERQKIKDFFTSGAAFVTRSSFLLHASDYVSEDNTIPIAFSLSTATNNL